MKRIGVKISFEADTFLFFITSSSVFVIVEQSVDFIIASNVKFVKNSFQRIVLTIIDKTMIGNTLLKKIR